MKVKDLIKMDIDIDVYDNVQDGIGIAFCGPMELTELGKKEFAEVIEYDCVLHNNGRDFLCIVYTDQQDGVSLNNYEERLWEAERFFNAMAGYCPVDDFGAWFVEI